MSLATATLLVSLTTVGGEHITLEPLPTGEETVSELRCRVALALGMHQRHILLYCDDVEVNDGCESTLLDVLSENGMDARAQISLLVIVKHLDLQELQEFIAIGGPVDNEVKGRSNGVVAYAPLRLIHPYHIGGTLREEFDGSVCFPEPRDININMLPFVMGQLESLPEEYWDYWDMIEECRVPPSEHGKICYLTIQENLVPKDQSQRRPGVHIESPGLIMTTDGKYHRHRTMWGCGAVIMGDDKHAEFPRVEGGIYMASTVAKSCALYNALIKDPGVVVGRNGDLEHVRTILGQPQFMEKNVLYWMTDRTPHESLPLSEETYRQFFRLVTSNLSAWFPEHPTANRLGTMPDPGITKIITGSKFT